jgi:hypothetical protein
MPFPWKYHFLAQNKNIVHEYFLNTQFMQYKQKSSEVLK